jgi:hypothetical protein
MDQQSRGLLAHPEWLALLGALGLLGVLAVRVAQASRAYRESESQDRQAPPVRLVSPSRESRAPRAVRDRLESQGLWDQQAVTDYLARSAHPAFTSKSSPSTNGNQ